MLLDCTNPLTPDFGGLVVGTTDSGANRIAARLAADLGLEPSELGPL